MTSTAGHAVTGNGTLLPTRDVIRMIRHAYHYLVVFDDHQSRPVHLGRSRRNHFTGSARDTLSTRSRLHVSGLRSALLCI
ncbi:DUF222 domain-containing protein [Mycobacterium leprae]|uniref:DUF222 domain-containing protein n=1 Tax=Mycobacterium leprae TaxID=1769 RepID=A0AAD0P6X5_MYCLR|nr:DUF222 domain-containing protein [Mycobacterium leprae]